MQQLPTQEQKKKAKELSRCKQCARSVKTQKKHHMRTCHPELGEVAFEYLKWGEMPVGSEKYFQNWNEIWNDDFEPVEILAKEKNSFK